MSQAPSNAAATQARFASLTGMLAPRSVAMLGASADATRIGGRPIAYMQRLGYAVSPHVVDAADFGVPQHRERLFIVCTRSKAPLRLKLPKLPYTPINSVIDWGFPTWSRVDKPGRKQATLDRAAAGRRAFGDRFVMPFYGSGSGKTGRSIHRPIGTLTTRDRWAIVDGDRMRMLQKHEARAAMGFPDTTKLPLTHKESIHLLGNAVCPPIPAYLLREIHARA